MEFLRYGAEQAPGPGGALNLDDLNDLDRTRGRMNRDEHGQRIPADIGHGCARLSRRLRGRRPQFTGHPQIDEYVTGHTHTVHQSKDDT